MDHDRDRTERLVVDVVSRVLGAEGGALIADSSITDKGGLDSLKFEKLSLALEQALEVEPGFLERWRDEQALVEGRRYTLRSIAHAYRRARELRRRGVDT